MRKFECKKEDCPYKRCYVEVKDSGMGICIQGWSNAPEWREVTETTEPPQPKFTPGPLTVDSEDGNFDVRDGWGNVTAFPNPGHFSKETHRANMTLYAAAPDMYEALEAVLPLINGEAIRNHHVIDFPALQKRVEDALKKARGMFNARTECLWINPQAAIITATLF